MKPTKIEFNPQAILAKMVVQVREFARSRTSNVKTVDGWDEKDGTYTIMVESPLHMHWDLPALFRDHKHVHPVKTWRNPGSYDWASDTYMRDADFFQFKLKP